MDRDSGFSIKHNSFFERKPKILATSSGIKLLNYSLDTAVAKVNEEVLDHDAENSGECVGPCLKRVKH